MVLVMDFHFTRTKPWVARHFKPSLWSVIAFHGLSPWVLIVTRSIGHDWAITNVSRTQSEMTIQVHGGQHPHFFLVSVHNHIVGDCFGLCTSDITTTWPNWNGHGILIANSKQRPLTLLHLFIFRMGPHASICLWLHVCFHFSIFVFFLCWVAHRPFSKKNKKRH